MVRCPQPIAAHDLPRNILCNAPLLFPCCIIDTPWSFDITKHNGLGLAPSAIILCNVTMLYLISITSVKHAYYRCSIHVI